MPQLFDQVIIATIKSIIAVTCFVLSTAKTVQKKGLWQIIKSFRGKDTLLMIMDSWDIIKSLAAISFWYNGLCVGSHNNEMSTCLDQEVTNEITGNDRQLGLED